MGEVVAQQIVDGLVIGSLYVIIAMALTIIFGIFNIINLANGSLVTLGGYVCYFMVQETLHLNFFVGMVIAMLVMGLVMILLEIILFRHVKNDMVLLMVVTIGLMMIIDNGALLAFSNLSRVMSTGVSEVSSIELFGVSQSPQRLVVLAISVILTIILIRIYRYTKLGQATRAVVGNREAALALGINPHRVATFNYFISGALAGGAGALVGALIAVIPAMGSTTLLKGLVVIIVGGLGSIGGCIVAGFLIGVVECLSTFIPSVLRNAIPMLVLVIVLCVRPQGLWGKAH